MSVDRQVGPLTFELLWFACCDLPAVVHLLLFTCCGWPAVLCLLCFACCDLPAVVCLLHAIMQDCLLRMAACPDV